MENDPNITQPSNPIPVDSTVNCSSASAENPPPPDPFDPDKLRLSQDMTAAAGVKKILVNISVKKPSKEAFIRCHPDEKYRLDTNVIELKEENGTYLVAPKLWAALAGESTFSPRALVLCQTKQGTNFIWPLKLPGQDGRTNSWNTSALEAAHLAKGSWVRVQANTEAAAYTVFVATGNMGEPNWPAEEFSQLLRIAFKDRYIESIDHPVLKQLRGEV